MHAASPPSSWDLHRASARRRTLSLILTILAHLLILLLLLTLTPDAKPVKKAPTPATFTLLPEGTEAQKATTAKRSTAAAAKPKAAAAPPEKPADIILPKPKVEMPTPPPSVLVGGKEMFDAADISKMHSKDEGEGGASADDGKDSVAAYGPGEGPGGARLYNAEWYREPSRSELSTYLPANAPAEGWGMIACKTVPDFRVDDCRTIGESPLGSGLARSIRLAAWQFRVRPPRINGRAQIGAWVRIRIDYSKIYEK